MSALLEQHYARWCRSLLPECNRSRTITRCHRLSWYNLVFCRGPLLVLCCSSCTQPSGDKHKASAVDQFLCCLRHMIHAPETSAINRLRFSGANFWYVCHANLGLDSSGTRFWCRLEHCSIPSQKVASAWLNDDLWLVDDYCRHSKVSWSCFMQWC